MKIIGITSTGILCLLLGIAGPAYAQHEQQNEKENHAKSQEASHEQAKPQQQHPQPQHPQPQQHAQQQHAQPQRSVQTHQQPSHAQAQQRPEQNTQRAQQGQRSDQRHPQPEHTQRQQDNVRQEHAQQPRQGNDRQEQSARQQRGNDRPHRTQEQQRVQHSAWQQHRSQHWDSDHRNWQQRGGYHGYRVPPDRFRGYFGPDHGFRINGLPFLVVGGYPRFQYHGYWLSAVDPWPESWGDNWYDDDDVYVAYVDNGYYLYNRRYPTVGIAISISN